MVDEQGGPQGEAIERGIAEGAPQPAAPGTAAPVPSVEVRREVVDRLPVTQLSSVQAGQQYDRMRETLQANPRLVDDPEFMRTYGALAAQERGANLQPVLEQDLSQAGPFGRIPSPGAEGPTALTKEQWTVRLGAPPLEPGEVGPEGDFNHEHLNAAANWLRSYDFPPHAADRLAWMGWHLARRQWTKLDADRELETTYGWEGARAMRSDTEHMLKRFRKDAWGKEWVKYWAGPTGAGLHHPELIKTMHWLVSQTRLDNPRWVNVDESVLEEEEAAMRAQQAEREAQAQKVAQEREEAVRALQRTLRRPR